MKDPLRRKVFTLITNSPVGPAIPTLGSEAEWELQKDSVGYLLKNVKYGEFLYAAADDQSLVKGIRSIFTWKAKGSPGDDIGTEAHWEFTKYSEVTKLFNFIFSNILWVNSFCFFLGKTENAFLSQVDLGAHVTYSSL